MDPMKVIPIELLTASEIPSACELVERVFRENVAPLYSDEGISEFLSYCVTDELASRIESGSIGAIARCDGRIVGLIEIKQLSHIALLFVDTAFHGRGVGRKLFNAALEFLAERNPELEKLTVNSSPNSVGFYERLGFGPTGEETTTNGIRYLPMARSMRSPAATD